LAWCRVKFSMRLKFLGQRGHWNRWPEAVGVALGFVGSFAGRLVEPLVVLVLVLVLALGMLLFPADRLLLLPGVPSIISSLS
jgi:hypothetical protein